MLEKIASLPESTRSAEIEKLSKEELVELADEIIANASNIKYFSTAPDTRAVGNEQIRKNEIVLRRYIIGICHKIVEHNQILVIDNPNLGHGSLHRIKAIIKDIENYDLSPLRFHELLAENYVDHELGRAETFLCVAAREMNADRFISFIDEFKTALGDKSFNNYLQTPNVLSTDEQLNIYQIYVEGRVAFKINKRIKNKETVALWVINRNLLSSWLFLTKGKIYRNYSPVEQKCGIFPSNSIFRDSVTLMPCFWHVSI